MIYILDVPSSEQEELFIRKLRQCCVGFDFMDPVADLKGKEIKRATLNEVVDYITAGRGVLTEAVYPEIIRMVRSVSCHHYLSRLSSDRLQFIPNLTAEWQPGLRPGGRRPHAGSFLATFNGESDSITFCFLILNLTFSACLWIFSEILGVPWFPAIDREKGYRSKIRSSTSRTVRLWGSKVRMSSYVLNLNLNFHYFRERDFLKTVLHRIYGKFLGLRAFIRKQINNFFLR